MGVSLIVWRARIGSFSMPGPKQKFKCGAIVVQYRAIRLCLHASVIIALLLVIGGVERNPGPIDGSSTRQGRLGSKGEVLDLEKELHTLKVNMTAMSEEIGRMKTVVDQLKRENEEMREQNTMLHGKVSKQEEQSRRSNMLMFGVKDDKGETWEDTEKKVRDTLSDTLGMEGVHELSMERCHRLPSKKRGKPRPVIVKFSFYKEKERVMNFAKAKLRDSRSELRVSEDFTPRVRDARHNLVERMLNFRQEGKTAFLKFDKLVVRDPPSGTTRIFMWDAAQSTVREVTGKK